jgi:hypothetical protein
MPFTNVFDITTPPDTQQANQLGLDLRNLALNLQQRMAAISGLDGAKPNFAADAQPANWNGVLFFATDVGKIYQFNNPNWTDITSLLFSGTKTLVALDGSVGVTIPGNLLQAGSVIDIISTGTLHFPTPNTANISVFTGLAYPFTGSTLFPYYVNERVIFSDVGSVGHYSLFGSYIGNYAPLNRAFINQAIDTTMGILIKTTSDQVPNTNYGPLKVIINL